ncbi:acetate kinase [Dysgonomonas sp. PH5-45]|uniref:acetate kinase n=1 Tax=unclassified Dysgonomonas TaxID=2630389 RepID=UPI0024742DF2|nr:MULTISPECIES: acetate kinase [unclassified Dysgonomonas]MDH6355082.1 acetate kinase [Dysgonomonas sp. PH5-45]MDH6387982.1 acetate kinase [Dysgonomonas sp. PH5-37]
MKILVLNCGSSSIKYKLFDMNSKEVVAQGGIEKVGMKGSFLTAKMPNGDKVVFEGDVMEHKTGIEYILGVLTSQKYGCLKSLSEIDAVGHRLVHGGEKFNKSVLITDQVMEKVVECIDLAPLHNPPNIAGVDAVKELMGDIPQVGVFDTAFHQTMPAKAYMYGTPYSLYEKYAIRRYGFHGTSHRYVTKRACEFLGLPYEEQKIVSAHIGNGGSLAAVAGGKSLDTSMGMTPVEGLLMGTRSGDVDAGVLSYIMEKENVGPQSISTIVNKFSGLLGVSGVSSDMRELHAAVEEGSERAKLALEMFSYRVKKYIGAYAAALGGLDVLVFTGGIGENDTDTRYEICQGLAFMGIEIDQKVNSGTRGEEIVISTPQSKVKVVVIPTDEEYMIASDTMDIVSGTK